MTDGNYVISWGSNRRISLVSYNAAINPVLDMETLGDDCAAAGITAPIAIGSNGFRSKTGITKVILPECIYTAYINAFTSMSDLEEIVLSSQFRWAEIMENHKQCFSDCKKLATVYPRGSERVEGTALFPPTTTAIANNLFQRPGSDVLKRVVAPNATYVGEAAFQNCSGITNIVLSGDITEIQNLAFQNCSALVSIEAGDNSFQKLTKLGGGQNFNNCGVLTNSFDFSNSTITSVGSQAFYGANNVPEIRLPATLTSVAKSAFRNDQRPVQRRIWFYGAPPTFTDSEKLALGSNSANTPRNIVFVPKECVDAWLSLFQTDTWADITSTDEARNDFPTKSTAVNIRRSNVLGTSCYMSHYNNAKPYYVVQWEPERLGTLLLLF